MDGATNEGLAALAADGTGRRDFLRQALGVGALAGLGASALSCASPGAGARGAPARPAACPPPPEDGPPGGARLELRGLPYRQDDPTWGGDVMWDRDLVIRADHQLNGAPLAQARALLRRFADGNTIGNEGCLLTSLAMVLRLLAPADPPWTPRTLNRAAQELYYYTRCGLSMTTLYADLVSEVTTGAVQLCLKEEYLSGVPSWRPVHVHTSSLVRAYRSLEPAQRRDCLVMLKTGTYDDTVASHYLLLHPNQAGSADEPDPEVLDPAQPVDATGRWRLSDSARTITRDPEIAEGWAASGIQPTQIGGAWVFARCDGTRRRPPLQPLVQAWARELAARRD